MILAGDALLAEAPGWRPTGPMSHEGFDYGACHRLFGARSGAGPLLAAVDTNIVIELTQQLDDVEFMFFGQLDPDEWNDSVGALHGLMTVWLWRDIRFFAPASLMDDSPRPLRPDRVVARRSAVEAFGTDYWQRGGSEVLAVRDTGEMQRFPVVVRSSAEAAQVESIVASFAPPGFDGRLVRESLREGCQVIVTCDDDLLKCASDLRRVGLHAATPCQILEALASAGEFRRGKMPVGPAPDLQTLTTFFSLQAPAAP